MYNRKIRNEVEKKMADRKIPITGHTELITLLATPIRHSMSPAIHNAAFEKLGMDKVYLVFEVGQDGLEDAVKGLRAMQVRGWNVSMPNKTAIIPYLDKVSKVTELCGAVNTVINDNGVLTGTSTDGTGWVHAIEENGVDTIKGKKVVLLGAGGAAIAILAQAALDGASEIAVFNKKDAFWHRAQEKVDLINRETDCNVTLHDIDDREDFKKVLDQADILTNATSVGMKPHEDTCLVEEDELHEGLVVMDCVYNPKDTLLLRRAKAKGCKTVSGVYMMLYQGAASFKLWTGVDMPLDYVREKIGI